MKLSPFPLLVLALFATASCSAPEEAPSLPPETNRMQEGFAPTPYTADEIRASCEPGRTMVFRVEVPDHETVHQVFHFTREDDGTPLFQAWSVDREGNMIGEIASITPVWRELQGHASFPEERTTISIEDLTVPFGTFSCFVYTVSSVREGESYVQRFYFPRELAGPPLLKEIELGGKNIHRMTMIENESATGG